MFKKALSLFSFLICILVIGCTNEGQEGIVNSTPMDPSQSASLISILVESGFDANKLAESKDVFIYDGDMVIRKSDIEPLTDGLSSALKKAQQMRYKFVLKDYRVNDITVRIDQSIGAWTSSIVEAINAWNNIGSHIRFKLVSANADVTIYSDMASGLSDVFYNLDDAVLARTYLPHDNNTPGSIMSVNMDKSYLSDLNNRRAVLIHELGHVFGLHHTDQQPDNSIFLIQNTPTSDIPSIMNAFANPAYTKISFWDSVAVYILFPPRSLYRGEILYSDQQLLRDEYLISSNGKYKLVMQKDGNLVSYNINTNRVGMRTNTHGKPVIRAIMQTDGNFVLYNRNNGVHWYACRSPLYAGSRLVMQNDGNVVIYAPNGSVRWASNTMNY